jgi:hypothetical protein
MQVKIMEWTLLAADERDEIHDTEMMPFSHRGDPTPSQAHGLLCSTDDRSLVSGSVNRTVVAFSTPYAAAPG